MNTITIARAMDKYGGFALISLLRIFQQKKSPSGTRVLVVRLWAMGESVLTLPLIKKLKDEGHQVSVLTTARNRSVFTGLSYVDEILLLEAGLINKLNAFDIVIDTEPYLNASAVAAWYLGKYRIGFAGLYRSCLYDAKIKYDDKRHAVLNFTAQLEPLGISFKPLKLEPLSYSAQDEKAIAKLWKEYRLSKKVIGIHAGTAETATYRSWSLENFAELAKRLAAQGYKVLFTGSKSESARNEQILEKIPVRDRKSIHNIAGKTNLHELACLMKRFDCFVSNDTGPLHVSAAMGTKTVGLFGPNLPERFGPYGKGNVAIYKARDWPYSPCINVHKGEFRKCPCQGKCMSFISVEDVLKAIK